MNVDDILKPTGLDYEKLTNEERETLHSWLNVLNKSKLTLEGVKTYIASMKDAVEKELTKHTLDYNQDVFLKARLRNYLLLEAFLSTPEKAKQAIERQMAGMIERKGVK